MVVQLFAVFPKSPEAEVYTQSLCFSFVCIPKGCQHSTACNLGASETFNTHMYECE